MKAIFTFLISFILTIYITAQAPDAISYQAIVRDSENNLVTNQAIGMRISILQGSATGTPVYVETHSPTTNSNGLISIEIGHGNTSNALLDINWMDGPYFIKTETDPTTAGGTNYTISGTSQLLSVPFALHAKTVEDDKTEDADADPANELQTLSLDGNDLTISNGNTVSINSNTLEIILNEYGFTINDLKVATGNAIYDYEKNMYDLIPIGNQEWMAENLKSHYISDRPIDGIYMYDSDKLPGLSDQLYYTLNSIFDTTLITAVTLHPQVEFINICPDDTHMPNMHEWGILFSEYLNDENFLNDYYGDCIDPERPDCIDPTRVSYDVFEGVYYGFGGGPGIQSLLSILNCEPYGYLHDYSSIEYENKAAVFWGYYIYPTLHLDMPLYPLIIDDMAYFFYKIIIEDNGTITIVRTNPFFESGENDQNEGCTVRCIRNARFKSNEDPATR